MASSYAEAGDDESLFSIRTQQRLEQRARTGGVTRLKKGELWQFAFTYYSMTSRKSSIPIGFFRRFWSRRYERRKPVWRQCFYCGELMDRFEYVLMKVALLVLPLKLLLLGIQLAAFYGGLAYYAELHWMLSAIIPLIFLYFCRIQPLNCALSVVAAYYGWEVSWGNAVSVIFGLFALFFIVKAFEDATREVAT